MKLYFHNALTFVFTLIALGLRAQNSDTCGFSQQFTTPRVIRYDTYAQCHIGYQNRESGLMPGVGYRLKDRPDDITWITPPGNTGEITFQIPLNHYFELVAENQCGVISPVTTISTHQNPGGTLTVSSAVFPAIMEWNRRKHCDFYRLVETLPQVSIPEKTWLLQQMLLNGHSIPDHYSDTGLPPRDAFRNPTATDCQCHALSVELTQAAGPTLECPSPTPNFYCTREASDEHEWSHGFLRYTSNAEGPAKYEELYGEGQPCSNPRQWMDKISENYAILRFGMACVDAQWNATNCACDLKSRVNYSYNSTLSAAAAHGGLCFLPVWADKQAESYADDGVILIRMNTGFDQDHALRIESISRVTAFMGCGAEFDSSRVGTMKDLAFAGVKAMKELGWGGPIPGPIMDSLWRNYYEPQVETYLNTLTPSNWDINDGMGCGNISEPLFLSGGRIFNISVEKPLEIGLITRSQVSLLGRVSWEGSAKVASAYALSGVIPHLSFSPNDEPYCCSPAFVNYVLGSMGHLSGEVPIENMQNWVGSNMALYAGGSQFVGLLPYNVSTGGFRVPGEFNSIQGNPIEQCQTAISGVQSASLQQRLGVQVTDGQVWVKGLNPGDDYRVELYNAQGMSVAQGHLSADQPALAGREHWPTGVYVVHVYAGRERAVFKVFLE